MSGRDKLRTCPPTSLANLTYETLQVFFLFLLSITLGLRRVLLLLNLVGFGSYPSAISAMSIRVFT